MIASCNMVSECATRRHAESQMQIWCRLQIASVSCQFMSVVVGKCWASISDKSQTNKCKADGGISLILSGRICGYPFHLSLSTGHFESLNCSVMHTINTLYTCSSAQPTVNYNFDLFVTALPFFCSYMSCNTLLSTFPVGDFGI